VSRIIALRGAVVGILLFIICIIWFPNSDSHHNSTALTVQFLDVGQGDAILIQTPDGYEMLIDGGPSSQVLSALARRRSFFDRSIDVVIATHPDTDHIAGLVDVLNRYNIGTIIETAAEHDAPAAIAFEKAAGNENAQIITAAAGQQIQLGASTTIRVFSPYGDTRKWENNAASVVVQIEYGEIEFMLTGDAPSSIEKYLADTYGERLQSDVLKLGHHGSKTSSSEEFLKQVQPQYAVVSSGKDNRYGHPHEEVVTRASAAGAQLVSTAELGTIIFKTDGKRVWIEK